MVRANATSSRSAPPGPRPLASHSTFNGGRATPSTVRCRPNRQRGRTMCGIAGLLDPGWRGTGEELAGLARTMAAPLTHRGPDDEGTWVDPAAGIGFGHRRLAIIDL